MFPAFKPHEIPLLPFSYFRKLRDYYAESREVDDAAIRRVSADTSDLNVVEFEGPPVGD